MLALSRMFRRRSLKIIANSSSCTVELRSNKSLKEYPVSVFVLASNITLTFVVVEVDLLTEWSAKKLEF